MPSLRTALLALSLACCLPLASAQAPRQADRVPASPDLTRATTLPGHIPAWARPDADQGLIPDATPLRIALVLNRSPERQAAFTRLLADQQNPASPTFHHWLTPQQLGDLYGPTQHDLDALSAWLTARGLAVTEIAPSRVFLHVEGTAAALSSAFSITLHTFTLNGDTLRAPLTEPAIPQAFAALVGSITGLSETPIHPMLQYRPMSTQTVGPTPQFTTSTGTHFITPGDFATIFDLNSTYSAGINGAGQKVAIIGRSRVASTDISLFESNTGLPANLPNTIIPTTGVDPGVTGNGDQGEATLDLQRLLGTAPGVQADLVVSGSANGFNGLYIAAQYEVQTLLDPVMNISFGSCEAFAGPSGVNLWDTLFAQAASEGISVFVSAADSGAATCDAQFASVPAFQFRSINYICASSYATCVGGTQLIDTNSSQFWSPTNSPTRASALSYIPEGAWNEPQGANSTFIAASGGGGASLYVPKPAWQTGTGVPADGARDVPDISFPAAGHDGYYGCFALGNGDCAINRFEYFYGTSAAAPAMAGVTALLNQKTNSAQGNLNPLLYRTAAATPNAIHDATPATSGVLACSTATASPCNNSTPSQSSLTGGVAGFALTPGYDQATGLGSLDVANFLAAASSPVTPHAAGKLTVTASASFISDQQTATFTARFTSTTPATATGTIQFYADNAPLGAPVPLNAGVATTSAQPFPAAGAYLISAIYSGDATFAQTTAPGISLTVTGLASTPHFVFQPNVLGTDPTIIPVGSSSSFTITLPQAAGSPAPTGIVRLLAVSAGAGGYIATIPITGGGGSTPLIYFGTPGSYTLTAFYLGDAVYSPASSAPQPFTVQKVRPVATLATPQGTIGAGGYAQYYLNIPGTLPSPATGTIQLFAAGVPLGAPFALTSSQFGRAVSPAELFPSAGTYPITATYSGDAFYLPQTTNAINQTVSTAPANYTLLALPSSLALAGGTGATGMANVSVYSPNGFQGTVNLTCAVTYNGTGTANAPPTCTLSPTSVPLAFNIATLTANIYATAPHARPGTQQALRLAGQASLLSALLVFLLPRRRRSWRSLSSSLLLSTLFVTLAGCGSSSSTTPTSTTNPTPIPGTSTGSYTVTIAATTPGTPAPPPATIALTVN